MRVRVPSLSTYPIYPVRRGALSCETPGAKWGGLGLLSLTYEDTRVVANSPRRVATFFIR
jgi:hypothetical protein